MADTLTLGVTLVKESRHLQYLKLINGIIGLSVTETKVLAALMDLGTARMCTSEQRKKVKASLRISNINLYIKIFKEKGLIKPITGARGLYESSKLILPPQKSLNINIEWQ